MVTTLSGFKGTVTEVQEATRFSLAGAKAIAAGPADLKPTSTGVRSVTIAAGAALVCGVHYSDNSSQTISVGANAGASPRLDVIALRFVWAGDNSAASLVVKPGVVGSSTPPALTRVPGGTYEFPLAVVRVRPSVSAIAAADVMDVRVWGGSGGPFWASQIEYVSIADLPVAAELEVGTTRYTVTANDGAGNTTLSLTSAAALPWTAYDPVMQSNDGPVNLGAGGIRTGRYQLDPATNTCHVIFEIRTGTGTRNFGKGPFKISLPPGIRPSNVFIDMWGEGLLNTNVGDGFYNWLVKYLIRNDQDNFVVPYATTAGNDARMLPMKSAGDDGNVAGALPVILTAPGGSQVFAEPNVLTGHLSYIVA